MYWYHGNFGMRGNPDEGSFKIIRLFLNHSFLPNNCKSLVPFSLLFPVWTGNASANFCKTGGKKKKKNPSIVTFDNDDVFKQH